MGIETFIKSMCRQTAVYWGSPQPDGFGTMTYDTPREIKVRWDEKQKVVLDKKGKEIIADVQMLCPEDLEQEGMLYLGFLRELDSNPVPSDLPQKEVWEILAKEKVSMPKSLTQFVRTYSLSRSQR